MLTVDRCWSIVIVIPEEARRTRQVAEQKLIAELRSREDSMQALHGARQALRADIQEGVEIVSQVRAFLQGVSTDIQGLGLCPYAPRLFSPDLKLSGRCNYSGYVRT